MILFQFLKTITAIYELGLGFSSGPIHPSNVFADGTFFYNLNGFDALQVQIDKCISTAINLRQCLEEYLQHLQHLKQRIILPFQQVLLVVYLEKRKR